MTAGTQTHRDNPRLDLEAMTDAEVAARLQDAEYSLALARGAHERGDCEASVVLALADRVRELEIENLRRQTTFVDPVPEMQALVAQMEMDTRIALQNIRWLNSILGI